MPGAIVDLTNSSPPPPLPFPELKPTNAVLHEAINTAQQSRLRRTLRLICDSSADASRIAESLLLAPEEEATRKMVDSKNKSGEYDESDEEDEEDEEESESDTDEQENEASSSESSADNANKTTRVAAPTPSSQKRLRSRYATCKNCDEEFDVTSNGKRDCVWHPGKLEADYDADIWADHDEDCHGRISDLEDECPEGYRYTCCNRTGDRDGCRTGTHFEKVKFSKRMRF